MNMSPDEMERLQREVSEDKDLKDRNQVSRRDLRLCTNRLCEKKVSDIVFFNQNNVLSIVNKSTDK